MTQHFCKIYNHRVALHWVAGAATINFQEVNRNSVLVKLTPLMLEYDGTIIYITKIDRCEPSPAELTFLKFYREGWIM